MFYICFIIGLIACVWVGSHVGLVMIVDITVAVAKGVLSVVAGIFRLLR